MDDPDLRTGRADLVPWGEPQVEDAIGDAADDIVSSFTDPNTPAGAGVASAIVAQAPSVPVALPGTGNAALTISSHLDQPIITAAQLGIPVDGVTDASPRLATICMTLAGTGTLIRIRPGDKILMAGGAQVVLNGVGLIGDGVRDRAFPYGTVGSQIHITDTTKSPFLVQPGWSMTGLNFFWPNQTEAAFAANSMAPIAYPPLLAASTGVAVTHFNFSKNTVINAYDFINTGAEAFGAGVFLHNNIYAIRRVFAVQNMPETVFVDGNLFSSAAYENEVLAPGGTRYLINWTGANGAVVVAIGNGTPTSFTTQGAAGAFRWGKNYVFAYNKGVHVSGGSLDLCDFGDLSMDQVAFPALVEHGYIDAAFPAGTWVVRQFSDPYVDVPCTAFSVASPSPSQSGGPSSRISCGATVAGTGPLGSLAGDNLAFFDFYGDASALNNTAVAGSYDGLIVNCANADVVISGRMASVNSGGVGIRNYAARSIRLPSPLLSGWLFPIDNESTTTLFTMSGAVTAGTTGSYSIIGAGRTNIKGTDTCSLDKAIQP